MLIIPIENKLEWSKPPVMTIALILINLLIFLIYQGNDNEIAQRAFATYERHQLLELEREHFLIYSREHHPELAGDLASISSPAERDAHITQRIFFDRGFDLYLRRLWNNSETAPTPLNNSWATQRQEFESERNRISSIEAGMTPAEAKPFTFISSQFLHGGWDHLLGNMVFLFLFGFTLETVLRPHLYLGMYLASGLAANGLHLLLNHDSYIPVVGASGAISGLMGMYLALYRLRKIRFFYTVLFYFGEFRAPALFILPLWLAKELYGHFFIDSNTAYWAHIGGLLAGAGLMLFARKTQQEFTQVQDLKVAGDNSAQTFKKIQIAISNMDFIKAKMLARQLCETNPNDPRAWRTLYDLAKSQPQSKNFHEATFAFLKQFVARETPYADWSHHVQEVLNDYQQLHAKTPALSANLSLALAHKFWQHNNIQLAEKFLRRAQQAGVNSPTFFKLATQMANYYQQRQQIEKAGEMMALTKSVK